MTIFQLVNLKPGDLVKHKDSGAVFRVVNEVSDLQFKLELVSSDVIIGTFDQDPTHWDLVEEPLKEAQI